ncbi:DegT/DnrJ/EryC1/StrS family aminotransferase [Nitrosopumilus sp.]|uniref:DegT/DnrJ/EryC1/StrS family aminotransferase n=1 Tax=Nitrosopumilus sp. TaxID=2024843 RepID=UPI003D0CDFB2
MKKIIKLFSPKFDNKEISAAVNTIKSANWASGSGRGNVEKFENKFCDYINAKECVAVDNGTAALHLSLHLLNIKNKEILVPSFTFITTIHSIVYNGGIPIFVDIDPKSLCIDTNDLEKKISKKTKGIINMHYGGFPNKINDIKKISKKYQLHIVDDAAHACGAKNKNKKIGSENELTCFSFHPVKNLAMPKGGAITINTRDSKNLKEKLNSLRWCGIDKRVGTKYDITSLGYNYYMDEISASIGIEQLKKLDKMNEIRFKIAKKYNSNLNTREKMPISKDCSYHLFWIRVKNRHIFMKKMYAKGIETGSHYIPAHLTSYYKKNHKLPITEMVAKEVVTLPMHPNLTDEEIEFIIKTANSII